MRPELVRPHQLNIEVIYTLMFNPKAQCITSSETLFQLLLSRWNIPAFLLPSLTLAWKTIESASLLPLQRLQFHVEVKQQHLQSLKLCRTFQVAPLGRICLNGFEQ